MHKDARIRRNVIVIGGSMGSVAPLRHLLAALPESLDAAIFIVLHRAPSAESKLTETLNIGGPWRAEDAVDLEPIERGRVYVAPADHHLLISGDCVRVTRGPRENLARPAIDPLFRSAAAYCGSKTIAVVLSGLLNDGAAGVCAIKRAGGLVVVQAPSDAQAPEMPESALASTPVDYVVTAAEIPQLLAQRRSLPSRACNPKRSRRTSSSKLKSRNASWPIWDVPSPSEAIRSLVAPAAEGPCGSSAMFLASAIDATSVIATPRRH